MHNNKRLELTLLTEDTWIKDMVDSLSLSLTPTPSNFIYHLVAVLTSWNVIIVMVSLKSLMRLLLELEVDGFRKKN